MAWHWLRWGNPWNWRRWGVITALSGVVSAIAYFLQVVDEPQFGIPGAVCTLVAIVMPARQAIKERQELEEKSKHERERLEQERDAAALAERERLADLLEPLATKVQRLVRISSGTENTIRQHLKEDFVRQLAQSFGTDVRVSFYEYHQGSKNNPPRLTCDGDEFHAGRDSKSKVKFLGRTGPGDYLLEWMAQRDSEPIYVKDVTSPGSSFEKSAP